MKMNTLLTGNSITTNIKTYGELAMKIMRSFERFWVTSRLSTICLIAISLLFTSQVWASTDGEVSGRRVTLYVASGTFGAQGTLYTIDPATGMVLTTVGLLHDSANNPYGLTGLKYDSTTGILYAATSGQSPTRPSYLATVDPATALVTPIGPFGDRALTDLAIDPTTGTMYGISGFDQKFYTINTSTGQAVQTGSTGIGFANGGGFAAERTGALFGFSNFSFYSFNKTTGMATLIGATGLEGGGGIDNTHLRWLDTCDVTTGNCARVGQINANDLDALGFIPLRR